MSERPVLALVLALAVLLPACTGTKSGTRSDPAPSSGSEERPPRPEPESLRPWTDAFQKSAVLLAADIRIEGPVGLISHIATLSNPDELERSEKATPEGFLQTIQVRSDAPGARIKAQLDRLAIVAEHRLSVLERPNAAEVTVVATGGVYWEDVATKQEKRVESLRLSGKIGG